MTWKQPFSRDTRHLWILTLLILGGVVVSLVTRNYLVPESFGQLGPYRADALGEIAAQPSILQADTVCLECHVTVKKERADLPHEAVMCAHCHGVGRIHAAQARKAKETEGMSVDPAGKWDGDFLTTMDLYTAKRRTTCLVCHEAVIGKPDDFLLIDVAEPLVDTDAEKPDSPNVCLECHGAHDTATK